VSQTKKLKPSSFKEGDLCVEPLPMVVWLVGPSTRLGNNVTYSYPHDRKKAAYHAAPSLSHRSLCQCRHSKCSMSCQCRQSNFCRISLQQVLLLIRVFSKCLGPFTSRLTSFDLYHVSELCFSSGVGVVRYSFFNVIVLCNFHLLVWSLVVKQLHYCAEGK